MRWYRGSTHTHTSAPPASDANGSLSYVASWYRQHGYDFIFVTDHEHVSDVVDLSIKKKAGYDYLVLPGQEITQMVLDEEHPHGVRHGHVNALGTDRLILPLGYPDIPPDLWAIWQSCPPGGREDLFQRVPALAELFAMYPTSQYSLKETIERNVRAVQEAGGIAQINHPNLHWSLSRDDLIALKGRPYLLEIWNAFSIAGNLGGVANDGSKSQSTEELWDALLSSGHVVWATASDDAHEYDNFEDLHAPNPGKAWIVVHSCELDSRSLLRSIESGGFYATTGVTIAEWEISDHAMRVAMAQPSGWAGVRYPPLTRFNTSFIGTDGAVLSETTGNVATYEFHGDEAYVRARVTDSDGRRAWTQPVFFDGREGQVARKASNVGRGNTT